MLPKINRLTKSTEIQKILREGKGTRRNSLLLKIKTRKLPASSPPRFAVVVGRKVSKKATVRNKIKRQIREALRHELGNVKGISCVVMALEGSATLGFREIHEAIRQTLKTIQ